LINESRIARLTIAAFQIACFFCMIKMSTNLVCRRLHRLASPISHRQTQVCRTSECLSCVHQQMFYDRPQAKRGKKVNAPTITITLTNRVVNSGVVTGNVPNDGGTIFLRARLPAIASIGMIIMKRPISIVMPIVVLYQSVFAEMPRRLSRCCRLQRCRRKESQTSMRARIVQLRRTEGWFDPEIAAKIRITSGNTRTTSIAIFTSYDSSFFPRYSGVRPTINPAMKTASTT